MVLFFFFFFYKIREQEGGAGPVRKGVVVGTSGKGGEKDGRTVNTVQKMYRHVCKCKNEPFETIPGVRGRRDKGEWWRG
jgi:hypothetical protein